MAICVDPDGRYEYRGVRVRDGAKLVTSAEPSGDGGFVAENDGVTYSVTASSLVVAVGERVIRDEPMIDFQKPNSPAAPKPPAERQPPPAPLPPAEPEPPPAPLPPPLPAEAGAG